MKKLFNGIFYLLISMILITVIAVLFLLNSTKTIEWAADKYAPQYGFGYKSISGGLLTGLEVEDLTFKGDKLLDRLKIRWNPAPLLRSRVSVTHLEATALDVESIKRVVSAFSSDKEDNSTSVLPVSIGVRKLHITVNPFEQSGIEIRAVSLGGKDIVYSSDGVDIDDFLLAVDTNISSLRLGGGANDGKVEISKISLLDIDTVSLRQIADGFAPEGSIEQNQTEPKEISLQNESAKNELLKNPLIPHTLSIDRVEVSVKPAEYPQFMLNRGELNATAIMVDIGWVLERKPEAIGVGGIQLLVDTNLTQLSLDGDLEKDIVTINSLSIRDIDTLALKELFASDETVKREPVESEAPKESMPTDSDANPLIPKYLIVKHLDSSILSATYDPLLVKSAEVNATDIKFDIQKLVADSGEVDIYVASSFANLIQHGVIKSNQIESRGHITPLKLLFETYKIPLREDALGHIVLDINANREKAEVDIVIDGKDILQADDGGFNLNTLHLANHITYLVSKSSLTVKSEGDITTPYTKNLKLDNLLTFEDGVLGYRGEVDPGPLEGIDGNYTKPLDDLKITYRGDEKSIEALIDSEGVIGKFVSLDFKKGEFDLATKTPLVLKNMVSLPEKLQEAQASLDIHLPLD
ncbi:MAG: hypothetical protein U9R27_04505, partial [Campylobacterota bacterium]|nr:hypothetical protein [Campylobacterota bacterium]